MPDSRLSLIRIFFCLLILGATFSLAGQADNVAEVRVVRRMRVEGKDSQEWTGEKRYLDAITVQTGRPYDAAKVRESIEKLYATGRVGEIQVDSERRPDGVVLTFLLEGHYFVGGVRVTGAPEPPNERQLANVTKLELGELYTKNKGDAAVAALHRLLENNGYHRARIETALDEHPETQQVDLRYTVHSGEQARIADVEVQGQPGFLPQKLADQARLKTGARASSQRFLNALSRLRKFYLQHELLGARVDLVERRYLPDVNKEHVVLRAQAGSRVVVRVAGDKVSDRTLRALLPIYEEGAVDPELVREGSRNLRDYYQGRGFFEAQVTESRAEDPQTGIIRIEYQVQKGARHTLDRVEIRGNKFFNEATLRERLLLSTGGTQGHGRFVRSQLDQDMTAIRELYRNNGFAETQVVVRVDDDYQGKKGLVHVLLHVDEGPQTLVRKLTIQGNSQIKSEDLLDVISQSEGQSFSESNAANDRDNILSHYFNNGFPNAAFHWKATPVEKEPAVDLEYTIEEGERQFVNRVLVAGQENTRETVISRQVLLESGQPLAQSDVMETQRNLYDLGIFNKVGLAVQNPDGEETSRNMLLQVEEAKRWTISVGAGAEIARIGGGLTSLENPQGATGFSPRVSLDVTRLNFRGRDHTLTFKSIVSTQQQRASLSYTAPRFWDAPKWTLFLNTFADRTSDVRTFAATRLEGSAALAEKRSKSDTYIFRFSYRRVQVDQSTLKITPGLIPLLSRPVRVGIPSFTYLRDRRDNPTDSKKGEFISVDLGVSSTWVGSEANFNRLLAQYTTYHPFGKKLVLARTTQFGLQEAFGGLRQVVVPQASGPPVITYTREIPLPERFFSGGGNSHRGFSVNQAGPRDLETGFPVGGNGLLMNSVELRFPVRGDDFGGVLFHDAGNVYTKVGDISFRTKQRDVTDFNYMVHSVGAGVRYKTPIGPLRVDFGYALNPPRFFGLHGSVSDLLKGTAPSDLQRLSHFQFFFSIGQTY